MGRGCGQNHDSGFGEGFLGSDPFRRIPITVDGQNHAVERERSAILTQ
jgi:hypothetical protein